MNPSGVGLLLLSGGQGRRMGAPKHALAHPSGGSWGGHLVGIFERAFPGAPMQVLGEPIPDHPGLPVLDDPRRGPASALRVWATSHGPSPRRWWVVACDQVRWTVPGLEAWLRRAVAADPAAAAWVLARHGGRLQPLGGWFPESLRPLLAATREPSLQGLAAALPHLVLPCEGPEWIDVDTPEERSAFEERG